MELQPFSKRYGINKILFTLQMFGQDHDEMIEDLEQGDVAETISKYFETSIKIKPSKKSLLTMHEVDRFLNDLTKLTREEDQLQHFASITGKYVSSKMPRIICLNIL